jgi:Arc/MetJ family transcription regulator
MTKRLIEIEDALLEQARRALGTETIKDTVTTALQQVVHGSERRARLDDAALERFAEAAADLGDDEVMGAAWR